MFAEVASKFASAEFQHLHSFPANCIYFNSNIFFKQTKFPFKELNSNIYQDGSVKSKKKKKEKKSKKKKEKKKDKKEKRKTEAGDASSVDSEVDRLPMHDSEIQTHK